MPKKPRAVVLLWGAAIVLVGGFVLWLQVGLVASFGALALSGNGLQSHLSGAAQGLINGDYELGEAEFLLADESTALMLKSVDTTQVRLMGAVPGLSAAVQNWRNSVEAAASISAATGELINLYGDLSGKRGGQRIFTDGRVNIERLEELPAEVGAAKSRIDSADSLLRQLTVGTFATGILERIRDLGLRELEPVSQAVNSLNDIAPVLPNALGADSPKRYLIAVGNQAEMRASGGAPLTLIMIEFQDGQISIPLKGQTSTQLFPPINADIRWFGPALNPFFAQNPRDNPFVVTNTHPNFLYSAQEMVQAWSGTWAGASYPEVDGVVAMDLTAIAAVLNATGPVESSVYGTVTGDQIGQILLVDAYATFGQEEADQRQAANQQLLDELLTRVLSGSELVPAAQAIVSTAPGRHFQMWMREASLEQLALDAGAAGVVEDPSIGDWSAMYTQNGNQSKVDVFQQRNVLVRVNLAADGSAQVNQQLTLTNATPPDRPEGPPERVGYETMWLRNAYIMYVPDAAKEYRADYPVGFTVRPFRGHKQLGGGWVDDGFGHRMIRLVGWTPPGGQSAMSVSYTLPPGTFTTDSASALEYQLQAEPQSLFIPSTLTVQVTPPAGYAPERQPGMKITNATATVSAVQGAPVNVSIAFEKQP
jgi:hypothetical protein